MHFTYEMPSGDLCQGDLLRRTEAVDAILREVHPHYLIPEYKLFMVVTQTCDLVRRGNKGCNSRYIEVATVRNVDVALQRQLRLYQDDVEADAGVCSAQFRGSMLDFAKRLLNNNTSEYFYLQREADLGFQSSLCALLRETIPLRAYQHYDTLLAARILSLKPTFQAKLGWLVGQIYARVATDDWVPSVTEGAFEQMANSLVSTSCKWIDQRALKAAKLAAQKQQLPPDEVKRALLNARAVSKKKEILDRVCAVVEEQFPNEYRTMRRTLLGLLASDDALKGMF